jgi:hypothetical protein
MEMLMKGNAERKIYSADGPRSNIFNQTGTDVSYRGLDVPTVVVQQTGEAWNRPFVAIFEPYSDTQGKTITSIASFTPVGADADFVGLTVSCLKNRKETIFSAVRNKSVTIKDMTFYGLYGVVSESGSQLNYIYLGAGKSIAKGAWSISSVNLVDSACTAAFVNDKDGIRFTASATVNLTVPDTFTSGKQVVFRINGTSKQYIGIRSIVGGFKIVTFGGVQAMDYMNVSIQ